MHETFDAQQLKIKYITSCKKEVKAQKIKTDLHH